MNNQENIIVIIPALNPDNKMIMLIKELRENGYNNIIVVNDGSKDGSKLYFKLASQEYNCVILKHAVNLGKGQAVKTAFNYILNECPDCVGAIVADCDGQHLVKDIVNCTKALVENPTSLIMGVRNFDKKNNKISTRTRLGNKITSKIIYFLCGIKLSDTQTGLRGIPRRLMKVLMTVQGERFEYEMYMLIKAKDNDVSFIEVPIETVHIKGNIPAKFNPLRHSLKIYLVFAKFVLSSLSATIIDMLMFLFFINIFEAYEPRSYILLATVCARIISATINFSINRNRVFKAKYKPMGTALKYIAVALFQMCASGLLVAIVHYFLPIGELIIKIVVDALLFVVGFQFQREWVFKNKPQK